MPCFELLLTAISTASVCDIFSVSTSVGARMLVMVKVVAFTVLEVNVGEIIWILENFSL